MHRDSILRTLGAALLLGAALSLSACVIHSDEVCHEECYSDVYCDPWGCWEEESCECVYYEDNWGPECYRDRDCPADYGCFDGWCEPTDAPTPARGDAGFCQTCNFAEDCAEPGALCVEFDSGERACARACDANNDCPTGFECLDISPQPDHANQCIPSPDEAGVRSCFVPDDGACLADRDCDHGLSCIDGRCAEPVPACHLNSDCEPGSACINGVCTPEDTPECREDRDCDAPTICRDNTCVDPCDDPSFQGATDCDNAADCPDGQLCTDHRCAGPTPNPACTDDAACDNGQVCVDGACADPAPQTCTDDHGCTDAICLDGLCAPAQCSMGADCGAAQGFLCVGGHCRTACADAADCAEGEACVAPGFCALP